jgi:adenine-specific DNA-methyltransferase
LRVLALTDSNFHTSGEGEELLLTESTLRREEIDWLAIAAEVLLKEGVPLHAAWERHKAAAATVIISEGVAVVMSLELTNEIADAALALEPKVVVFLEDGFAGADAVKANTFTNAKNANIVMKTV